MKKQRVREHCDCNFDASGLRSTTIAHGDRKMSVGKPFHVDDTIVSSGVAWAADQLPPVRGVVRTSVMSIAAT